MTTHETRCVVIILVGLAILLISVAARSEMVLLAGIIVVILGEIGLVLKE